MPSTLRNITLYRGLTWQGLRCMAVNASGDPVALEGTALLQARKAPGKPLSFSLPVTLGEAQGEIVIPEVSAVTSKSLPLGVFMFDLVLIDSDGKAWPPVMHGEITVKDPISKPELS